MKKYQASCDDGWKSKVVSASDKMAAAKMLWMELEEHVKNVHSMPGLGADEAEKLKATEEHLMEVE